MKLMRGRPKILLATSYEDGLSLFESYRHNLLGVISDVSYSKDGRQDSQAGFIFLKYVRSFKRYFPFLIQSSERKNEKRALELNGKFLFKHSETLEKEIKNYIIKYFSFGDFEFWDPNQMKVLARVKDLKNFQKALSYITVESISYHAERSEYSKWLKSRALFPLADLFSEVEYSDFENPENIREFLIDAIKTYRVYRSRGVIAKFDSNKYDEYLVFSRIGEGALGGKGRGLAFIDSFLKRNKLFSKFKDVTISIPQTVVLSTEVFDEFMDTHDLIHFVAKSNDDEAILNEFISKPLPKWVRKDIKAYLEVAKNPIAVRSSSVLEDSHYQPFAGVFATYMVPCTDDGSMLDMVCNAVKSVMASAFTQSSKAYLRATSHSLEDDKMAVILQEVIGKQYEDVFIQTCRVLLDLLIFIPWEMKNREKELEILPWGLGK